MINKIVCTCIAVALFGFVVAFLGVRYFVDYEAGEAAWLPMIVGIPILAAIVITLLVRRV